MTPSMKYCSRPVGQAQRLLHFRVAEGFALAELQVDLPEPFPLAGVQDAAPVPVTIITSERNLGFPAAVNRG